ncbi:MAG: DNA topoisomerase VI subunit B, partial [Phycisphaerales bacterium]|nr:DNA topoisomerase VI subunit B [Phycisphaerales bacterium]
QGIGISAAGMYGLMTTGKPMVITTRPHKNKPAHHLELAMDTTKNKPEVTVDIETEDFPAGTGTRVSIEMEAKFFRGKGSVETYLEQTAISNPHCSITFIPPDKANENPDLAEADPDITADEQGVIRTQEFSDRIVYPRTVDELPPETEEIKPHPYGVELGTFLTKLKQTDEKQLTGFFKNEFCRVPPSIVTEVTKAASTKSKSFSGGTWVNSLDSNDAEKIYKALQESKLRAPPTDCLSPIGVKTMLAGLLKGVKAEFYTASTRKPAVYRGNPFQIEAAIAYGGELPGDQQARVIRYANRVPLLYQQSACSAFKSVVDTSWKNYGLQQPRGGAPVGPLVVMIHMASVWVPFTSESKEAIADYDDIRKEMQLALQECGRKLGQYIRRRQRMRRDAQKRDVFERYIGEIAKACNHLTNVDTKQFYDALLEQAKARTEIADAQLDDEGNFIKDDHGRLAKADDVIILDSVANPDATPDGDDSTVEAKPTKKRSAKKASKKKRSTKQNTKSAAGLFGG